jgi:23S rRNA (cytidine1920-2'-O)/16S rRNA (cytidine1409-2'-O)-methyltransferase
MSERLDKEMLAREIVSTRSQASMLIKQGDVLLNGKKCTKPGKMIEPEDQIEISERDLYVGRGAYKLISAIEQFNIDLAGKVIADCGASTGGFTQVSLMKGAKHVYAIDVGHDQLDESLKSNSKVSNMEGVNLKFPCELPELIDFCLADLSFISIKLVYPTMKKMLKAGGKSMVLIKPQFEAGKERLGKGGLVKKWDQEVILQEVLDWFKENGHQVEGHFESPIKGKTGNVEYLALIS